MSKLSQWGQETPSGQRRRRTVSKHLASSMRAGMCIMTPVSPIDFERTSARCKARHPEETVTYQLPGIHLEPKGNTRCSLDRSMRSCHSYSSVEPCWGLHGVFSSYRLGERIWHAPDVQAVAGAPPR